MKKSIYGLLAVVLLGHCAVIMADIVGSNKIVTRVQAPYTFPNNRSGFSNTILGFTYMEQGFALKDDTTTCTFDGSFPVKGNIALNGGRLDLLQSLVFSGGGSFVTGGTIACARNKVVLDVTEENLQFSDPNSTETLIFDSVVLEVLADLVINVPVKFTGNSTINCYGHTVYFGTGSMTVGTDATLCIRDAVISDVRGTKMSCEDATGQLLLQKVTWHQSDDYTFAAGLLSIKHDVIMQGNAAFFYTSTQPLSVSSRSNMILEEGFTFQYDPQNGAQDLLQFADATATLTLRGGSLNTGSHGLMLKKGLLNVVADSSIIASEAAPCIVGDQQTAEEMRICIAPGCALTLQEGVLALKNSLTSSWRFNGVNSVFRLNTGSILNLFETLDTGIGALYCEMDSVIMKINGSQLLGRVHAAGIFSSMSS